MFILSSLFGHVSTTYRSNTISYSYLRSFCPSRTFFNIYNNRHHLQHEDFTQTISSCQRQTRFLSHPHRAFPFLATCRPHVAGAWGPWQGMWPGINSMNEWVGLLVDAVDSGNVLKRMPNVFCHQDHQDKEDKKKARRKHKVPCLNDIRAIRGAGLCKDVRHLVIRQGCLGACFFMCQMKWRESETGTATGRWKKEKEAKERLWWLRSRTRWSKASKRRRQWDTLQQRDVVLNEGYEGINIKGKGLMQLW